MLIACIGGLLKDQTFTLQSELTRMKDATIWSPKGFDDWRSPALYTRLHQEDKFMVIAHSLGCWATLNLASIIEKEHPDYIIPLVVLIEPVTPTWSRSMIIPGNIRHLLCFYRTDWLGFPTFQPILEDEDTTLVEILTVQGDHNTICHTPFVIGKVEETIINQRNY